MIPLVRGSPDCEAQLAASLVELAQRLLSEAQNTVRESFDSEKARRVAEAIEASRWELAEVRESTLELARDPIPEFLSERDNAIHACRLYDITLDYLDAYVVSNILRRAGLCGEPALRWLMLSMAKNNLGSTLADIANAQGLVMPLDPKTGAVQ